MAELPKVAGSSPASPKEKKTGRWPVFFFSNGSMGSNLRIGGQQFGRQTELP